MNLILLFLILIAIVFAVKCFASEDKEAFSYIPHYARKYNHYYNSYDPYMFLWNMPTRYPNYVPYYLQFDDYYRYPYISHY